MGHPEKKNRNEDEAYEKMLIDQINSSPNKDNTEVVFMAEDGEAKIKDKQPKRILSGMCKEELLKYANDPFWVKLRCFLFVGFWILWIAMLAGAIAIIIMAPKCTTAIPKKWWEKNVIVQLGLPDLAGKDGTAIELLLDTLKNRNIHAVTLTSILAETQKNHIVDFYSINSQLTIKDLANFIDAAKNRSQKVVLEFDINHSAIKHDWFNKSVYRVEPFTNYYVWANGTIDNNPPNNWLSLDGGSAWEWNDIRKQYYLHQFTKTQPDLNFNNPAVIDAFTKIFVHWIKFGFNGFRLGGTQYLTEDISLHDEMPIQRPAEPLAYKSFNHVYTKNRHPENTVILAEWRDTIANITNNEGLFTLKDEIGDDALDIFNDNKISIDLPQRSSFIVSSNADITAQFLQKKIDQLVNGSWPGWDFNVDKESLEHRLEDSTAQSLILMSLLLPGTPIVNLSDTASSAFQEVAAKRNEETFLYGDFQTSIINETVFTYVRMKSGNPGYLVAYQSSDSQMDIDVSSLPQVPSDLTVLSYSKNYNRNATFFENTMPSNRIPVSPKSTLVLTFVAKD